MEEIFVQEYAVQYKEEVIDLILNIQQNEFKVAIKKEDQPDLSDVPNFYQNGVGNFWIALCGNEVVGTISLLDIGNSQTALRKMFVKAPYRGIKNNPAAMLLAQATEWARQKSISEIFLGTTDKYLAAHRFYDKNGFQRISIKDLPESFPIMQVDSIFYKYVL